MLINKDAINSSKSIVDTATSKGYMSDRSGTAMTAEPKPVIPNMVNAPATISEAIHTSN